jgi:hypothetical protein
MSKSSEQQTVEERMSLVTQEAKDLLSQGVTPIRLSPMAKNTPGSWAKNTITSENVENLLMNNTQWNLGVLLGEPSGGLVDIDLDIPEAALVAEVIWPSGPTFGRKSNPKSHRLIICSDAEKRIPFTLTH